MTASLIGRSKLEARSDSTPLEGTDLEKALKNSNLLGNIVVTPQVEFQLSQVKRLRDFYKEFFDAPIEGNDAKAIGVETASAFDKLRDKVRELLALEPRFPFLSVLSGFTTLLGSVTGKPATWYVTDLPKFEDQLLDAKEIFLDPILKFMGGQQRGIYEEISTYLSAQAANFAQAGQDEADAMRVTLANPSCYKGTAIQELKTRYLNLKNTLDLKIIEERKAVEAEIAACRAKIEGLPELGKLTPDQRNIVLSRLDGSAIGLANVPLIAVLRNKANDVRSSLYPSLLAEVDRLAKPVVAPKPNPGLNEAPVAPLKPTEFVNNHDIKVPFAKAYLSEEADVNDYVETLRTTLLAEIRSGKRIVV